MQAKTSNMPLGIDVSHHNGAVDFVKVKNSGVKFVYVKATEGVSFTSPALSTLVKGAKAQGLPVGCYHFARPTQNSAVDEANYFYYTLKSVLPDMGDLAPVLDLEAPTDPSDSNGEFLVQWARDFINQFMYLSKRSVTVYTGNWYLDQFGITNLGGTGLDLWLANYKLNPPPDSGGWTRWTIFQYTENGLVSGISGNVDLNVATSIDEMYGYKIVDTITRVTTSDLNVRWGYSTDYSVREVIPAGTIVHIDKLNTAFAYSIEHAGWVSRKYLTMPQ
jgi:GH25 family lysozyme M1 (1,4-beta-N-acetylmuramidase)